MEYYSYLDVSYRRLLFLLTIFLPSFFCCKLIWKSIYSVSAYQLTEEEGNRSELVVAGRGPASGPVAVGGNIVRSFHSWMGWKGLWFLSRIYKTEKGFLFFLLNLFFCLCLGTLLLKRNIMDIFVFLEMFCLIAFCNAKYHSGGKHVCIHLPLSSCLCTLDLHIWMIYLWKQ